MKLTQEKLDQYEKEAEDAWNNEMANKYGSFCAGDLESLSQEEIDRFSDEIMSCQEIIDAEGMRLGSYEERNGLVKQETFEDFVAKSDKVTEGFKGFQLDI